MAIITAKEAAENLSPVFDGKWGGILFTMAERLMGIDLINGTHDRIEQAGIPAGPDFAKAILDDIDASWPYAAVSGLRIEKLGDDVRFPDEAAPKKDGPAAGAPAPAADANRPARRTIRLVSGALREQLVQVELYLDLYRMDASEENPDASSDEEDL